MEFDGYRIAACGLEFTAGLLMAVGRGVRDLAELWAFSEWFDRKCLSLSFSSMGSFRIFTFGGFVSVSFGDFPVSTWDILSSSWNLPVSWDFPFATWDIRVSFGDFRSS